MTNGSGASMWLIVLAVIVAWPLFCFLLWSAILYFMSALGGWNRLAERYAVSTVNAGGRRFTLLSGMVGLARYNRVLTATTNSKGFYLEVRAVFRYRHPPIFVPWADIRNARRASFLNRGYVDFDIGSPSVARMRLQEAVFDGAPVDVAH